ncbi:glycosyltransferase [Spiribacter roseus]|uniref:glycosyltransferase n=1 Tax=Spiribacter roseus TaxID=1855875 RepID=UPI001330689D|nr:glycosyltransferase [Spiribacter roseus]
MENRPLVSIYLPTFNRLALLKRAVHSVLDQTYRPIELLIVDDGSTDGSIEYIESMAKKYHYIKKISKDGSRGAPSSRNAAISIARGKYITGLDDDDYFKKNHIEKLVAEYEESYSCIFAKRLSWGGVVFAPRCIITRKVFFHQLVFSNIIGNQVLTETYKLQSINGFDESFDSCQDYETWLRMTQKYGPAKVAFLNTYVADKNHGNERISNKIEAKKKCYLKLADRYKRIDYAENAFLLKASLLGEDLDIPLSVKINCMNWGAIYSFVKKCIQNRLKQKFSNV